jgi:hypothetical protein
MVRSIRDAALALGASVAAAYLAGAALVARFPDRLLAFPEAELSHTPGALGLRHADVWIEVGPGGSLVHGWWLPNGEGAPVVLLLPGTGRTIAGSLHVAAALLDAGAAVLMIDYRGFGRSDRAFTTEATMLEDAKAAWQQMRWFQGDPARCLVYGHALGAAVALELAARSPDTAGVILEGAPTSMRELLAGSWVARIFPVDWLARGRFDVAARIARVQVPVLLIHGRNDPIVPPAMSSELHRRAKAPASLVLIDRARHGDAAMVGASEYTAAIGRLLPPRQVLVLGPPSRTQSSTSPDS